MRRYGRFWVKQRDLYPKDGDYRVIHNLMKDMVVLQATWDAARQAVEYIAYHPDAKQVADGEEAPLYEIERISENRSLRNTPHDCDSRYDCCCSETRVIEMRLILT
jgi:hypothetical protein